ncbi:hypothetical protein [Leptospira interrogans]|uniref:hypothetical protein n=1 Tax=Leptospira interrogans TaxID=173 RepID=UPI0002BA0717|nr:hypothetical protein [Leptospira interrogans]EMO00906.1 hypothetical protein LEP1GSC112_0463 [Leptospira interrogans serovar Pomona str. UT364]QOI36745.1 hypothetical protein LeptoLang_21355 [Leptospira interrogans serovar Icterohaemorrhagiae]
MGREWSVDDSEFIGKLRGTSNKLGEAIIKALKIVILGIPAKISSSSTGIRPQRDTSYMQGAYSSYVGKEIVADEEIESPKKKSQFKLPPVTGFNEYEATHILEAPYAASQNAGQRELKDGRIIQLKGKKPGTGPGWLDKLTEPDNSADILEELNDHIKDNMKEYIQ